MDINLKQFGYVMYVMHSDEDQHEYQSQMKCMVQTKIDNNTERQFNCRYIKSCSASF